MPKESRFLSIMNRLRLLTYICATVLLIINNDFQKLTYLVPLVLLLLLINYSRDYYLVATNKPIQYIWISIALELLLIIGIGIFDITDVNLLFYYVCLSTTVISYPFLYATPLVILYIASAMLVFAVRNGFGGLMEELVPMLLSYGISTAFVMVMSYLVKVQVREKEKLKHINLELEQAYKKLIEHSAVAQKLTVEQERTRMAREIHDTLAHTLTTSVIQLEACKKLAFHDPSRLPAELEKAQELSRSGLNDVKRTIKALRPQAMEDKTFFASILSIISDTMDNTEVNITYNNLLSQELKLASQVEIALFRVIQESITNSIRHGQAGEIDISIGQEQNTLQLSIVDNGIGCSSIKKGYGMQGIRERIDSLNGSVEFSGSDGFRTEISIPYEVA